MDEYQKYSHILNKNNIAIMAIMARHFYLPTFYYMTLLIDKTGFM